MIANARRAGRNPAAIEIAVIVALFAMDLSSFGASSPVHGPLEIFGQDSVYLLESLAQGVVYPWNPQSHLLHHVLLERGFDVWQRIFGAGPDSAFRYLKLFTALAGLAFLFALRQLLRELGLDPARRIVILILAGLSVSVWFHFSAFETHCVALPALVIYLLSLARMRDRASRSVGDRLMFVGSLVVLGWTRVDLYRFAAASALIPLLPAAKRWRRDLLIDLALVAVLAIGLNAVTARAYLHVPWDEAPTAVLHRDDRVELEDRLHRVENLSPSNLFSVGRAVTLYSMVMPVETRPAGRSFFAPPDYDLDLEWKEGDVRPSTPLFSRPARNLLGFAVSLLAFAAIAVLLASAFVASVVRALRGDLLHTVLITQAIFGWLLYTWHEPFLWIVGFVSLWLVMIAELLRGRGRAPWVGVALAGVVLGVHNLFAFYLPFR
jgi:hypothetical protein